MAGEELRLLFPFFLSLLASKNSERVTFGRGNVSPQVLHVAGFFPAVYPYSTTDSGQDPVQPDIPHMMIGRQATGAMRCTQRTKTSLETGLDGFAEMANATETQAGGLDPDFSQNGLSQNGYGPVDGGRETLCRKVNPIWCDEDSLFCQDSSANGLQSPHGLNVM